MAEETLSAAAPPAPTSPEIEQLRFAVEQARLEKELAEQNAGRAKALIGDWSSVTAPTDTLTSSQDYPSGLADVHASRAALNIADDIADLVWTALNERDISGAQILVVGSTDVIADCDTYQVVRSSLSRMLERVESAGDASDAPEHLPGPTGAIRRLTVASIPSLIPAVTSALPAVVGVVSKLLGRSYAVSGKVLQGLADLGFDLQLANEVLRRAETATVRVGRLTPMPSTVLFEDVRRLAAELQGPLAVRLAVAEARLALHAERAKQAEASLDAARAQIVELVKLLTAQDGEGASPALAELAALRAQADAVRAELLQQRAELRQCEPDQEPALTARIEDLQGQLTALREQTGKAVSSLPQVDDPGGATPRTEALERAVRTEDRVAEQLPALRAVEAGTAAARDALKHTRDAALALLAEFLTVNGDEPPPLIRAGRAEGLVTGAGDGPQIILMGRVLRAGVDQVQETKLGPDKRSVLAGVTAEWALLTPTGELLACGVRTGLRTTEGEIGKLADLREHDVLYVGVPREVERERTAATRANRRDSAYSDSASSPSSG